MSKRIDNREQHNFTLIIHRFLIILFFIPAFSPLKLLCTTSTGIYCFDRRHHFKIQPQKRHLNRNKSFWIERVTLILRRGVNGMEQQTVVHKPEVKLRNRRKKSECFFSFLFISFFFVYFLIIFNQSIRWPFLEIMLFHLQKLLRSCCVPHNSRSWLRE